MKVAALRFVVPGFAGMTKEEDLPELKSPSFIWVRLRLIAEARRYPSAWEASA